MKTHRDWAGGRTKYTFCPKCKKAGMYLSYLKFDPKSKQLNTKKTCRYCHHEETKQ